MDRALTPDFCRRDGRSAGLARCLEYRFELGCSSHARPLLPDATSGDDPLRGHVEWLGLLPLRKAFKKRCAKALNTDFDDFLRASTDTSLRYDAVQQAWAQPSQGARHVVVWVCVGRRLQDVSLRPLLSCRDSDL